MQARVYDYFDDKFNGTCLQGRVTTTFDRLVSLLGEGLGTGDKTTQEWMIEFSDGTVATIYDWKQYETPLGFYNWHVGGHSSTAVRRVEALLNGDVQIG